MNMSDISNPDPAWLDKGDNAWQMTAASLVALQSLPGLAVLYAGLVSRRWVINSMMMVSLKSECLQVSVSVPSGVLC